MKGFLSHDTIFKTFRFIIYHYLKQRFNYDCEKIVPKNDSYIVLSNHTTNYDPLMVGISFQKLLYYVASDHIFRWGFLSNLIKFLVNPIPRLKATSEIQAVKQILKRLKNGENICIFAEGNRSFTGETGYISESTGKLIKLSGAALITYRLNGGYFSNPRWGKTLRRGSIYGRKIMEYNPEQIEKMTVDELNNLIQKDLYVNADEDQNEHPIAYVGEKLAENLEIALYICPKCGCISTLKSDDDRFYCSCGLNLRFTPYGSFHSQGSDPPHFNTVLDWSRWQSSQIVELATTFKKLPSDKPIISDMDQSIWQVEKASKSKLLCEGTLNLYKDRLVIESTNGNQLSFDFDKISDMSIYSRMILIFSTTDKNSYEIKSTNTRSAIKYLELYKALKIKKV